MVFIYAPLPSHKTLIWRHLRSNTEYASLLLVTVTINIYIYRLAERLQIAWTLKTCLDACLNIFASNILRYVIRVSHRR